MATTEISIFTFRAFFNEPNQAAIARNIAVRDAREAFTGGPESSNDLAVQEKRAELFFELFFNANDPAYAHLQFEPETQPRLITIEFDPADGFFDVAGATVDELRTAYYINILGAAGSQPLPSEELCEGRPIRGGRGFKTWLPDGVHARWETRLTPEQGAALLALTAHLAARGLDLNISESGD